MMADGDGLGITLVSIGGILVYAGIKGYSVPDVLRNVVQGRPIYENVNKNPVGGIFPGTPVTPQQVPGSSGTNQSAATYTRQQNQELANSIARGYEWDTGYQWDSLVQLWDAESSWDNQASNPSSGAYGIPQANPYTKMPKIAWPPSAGGNADPAAQIQWGLDYIAGRYATPSVALQFHKQNGYY